MPVKHSSRSFFASSAHRWLLSLLFLLGTLQGVAMPQKQSKKAKPVVNSMIVLDIAPPTKADPYYEVVFQVSQRQYRLSKEASAKYLRLLRESKRNRTPVLVKRAREDSDVILSVKKP